MQFEERRGAFASRQESGGWNFAGYAPLGLLLAMLSQSGCGVGDYDGPPLEVGICTVAGAQKITGEDAPLGFSAAEAVATSPVCPALLVIELYRDCELIGVPAGGKGAGTGAVIVPCDVEWEDVEIEVGIVAADLERVYWVKEPYHEYATFPPYECQPSLTFPITILFRTSDGRFDEELQTDLWVNADEFKWYACLPARKLRGTFTPPARQRYVPEEVCFGGSTQDGVRRGSVQVNYSDLRHPTFPQMPMWQAGWSEHPADECADGRLSD